IFAAWQTPQKLATREGNMEEKPNVDIRYSLSKHTWQKHEMVIVDPDDVSRLVGVQNAIGKELVHAYIVSPPLSFSPAIIWSMLPVVEESVQLMLGISPPP